MQSTPRFPKVLLAALAGGGLILLGGTFAHAAAAPTPAPGGATPPPVTPVVSTSFDEVAARLDKGGSFYVYLSAAQWFDKLSGHVTEWRDLALKSLPKDSKNPKDDADRQKIAQGFDVLAKLVRDSGIEQITGFGASSVALTPGLNRNILFVHHYKGKETGLLGTLFGEAPHPLAGLDFLPTDTAFASYGDFDLARFLGTLRDTAENSGIPEVKNAVDQGLAQFTAASGMSMDDLLHSLGGAQGLVLTLDPVKKVDVPLDKGKKFTVPLPRLALFMRMTDDRIFQRLDQVMAMLPNLIKVDEPNLRLRTMIYPATPDFTLRATLAQWDKFLVITSDDGLVRDMIAAQKSGQGFKATPEFAKLAAGMPTEGNGFTVTTQRFAETYKSVQAEAMNGNGGVPPEQKELFDKLSSMQNIGNSYSVSAHVDNGWLSVGKGSQGAGAVLLPLAAVPVGIAAGIAVPVFNTVQVKGKATKSMAQAKQIALACQLYASDHKGKFPPTLEALVPKYLSDKKLFVSPFAPDEAMGYTYTSGLTEKSPSDKVLLEDKFSAREHQRIVAHVDASAESTKVP